MTNLEQLKNFAENELHGHELSGYAATAAIRVLMQNWEHAIADGCTDDLLKDLDDVVEKFNEFHAFATKHMTSQDTPETASQECLSQPA